MEQTQTLKANVLAAPLANTKIKPTISYQEAKKLFRERMVKGAFAKDVAESIYNGFNVAKKRHVGVFAHAESLRISLMEYNHKSPEQKKKAWKSAYMKEYNKKRTAEKAGKTKEQLPEMKVVSSVPLYIDLRKKLQSLHEIIKLGLEDGVTVTILKKMLENV